VRPSYCPDIIVSYRDVEIAVRPSLFSDQRVDPPTAIEPGLDALVGEQPVEREDLVLVHATSMPRRLLHR
jgi:hypothetical protein